MARHEEHQAAREALREVTSRPDREWPHESAMARFLAGLAYEESRHEQHPEKDEQEKGNDHTSKPE